MKNSYVPVTLNGQKVGVAMVDNGRLLINIHDNRLRQTLWGSADNTGLSNISIGRNEDSEVTITIHPNLESDR